MSSASFKTISEFMKTKYGIDLSAKEAVVEGRLTNMINHEGYNSYEDYFNCMMSDSTGRMEEQLVNVLTTNHTYFMREYEHFDYLREEILPYFKDRLKDTKDLRIWCGAASTGEEPYTIAMTVKQFLGLEGDAWDTKVLATDVSTDVLQTAIAGEYPEETIDKLGASLKRRFFRKGMKPGTVSVSDELKNEVIFRQFNLMDEFPFKKEMHIVFLRNVMIYFDTPTRNRLVKKIYDSLAPGGYLIIGMTEAIDADAAPFEMVKPSIFRKPI